METRVNSRDDGHLILSTHGFSRFTQHVPELILCNGLSDLERRFAEAARHAPHCARLKRAIRPPAGIG
jgi:hypothetical protein